ncbi:MAG: PIG-L family deacetylase [Gaiellaceae bacterium]
MRRFGLVLTALVFAAVVAAASGSTAQSTSYSVDNPIKINVMGEWAHPDDDTSIIGPCGVWHQQFGIKCGIIMITRGEGGGNAVGTEIGPALGLRRENEDRSAHYRSGTTDIFNIDKVDFFFNQSAPETQFFWGHDDTLRRVTRIIRMTQPDVYIGFTPTLGAGHGNHQQAGRFIWEGMLAAANAAMFPDQLTGPDALGTWQVKKIFSGGSTAGTGGTTTAADCTTGFVPTPGTNLDTVVGAWTGYNSPYLWPAGNIQGKPAGTPKIWAQVASEGSSAYPTQSRVMFQGSANPGCSRFGQTMAFVPFQPNTNPDGTANPLAGKDNAILYGATDQDPGGLPLGTLEYLTFNRFFNVAGQSFTATLHLTAPGSSSIPAGSVALTVPSGWTVDAAKPVAPIPAGGSATIDFTVTPSASAVTSNFKIAAQYTGGAVTGYTDNVVRVVPAVEGRFHRWGKYAEFDQWLTGTAPQALRLGRSAAVQSMGMGETVSFPVDVHNWSTTPQSGTVTITAPADFTLDATSKPYGPLAPGADTTVVFTLTNTDTTLPGAAINDPGTTTLQKSITIATSYSTPASSASETLTMTVAPSTNVPVSASAPVMDGQEDASVYTGPALDLSRKWSGSACAPAGVDCGTAGTPGDATSSYGRVAVNNDNLYFFVHIRDDFQSYAVTPQECVAHWLADSVEFLIDPRGDSSLNNFDTGTTFKLGVFPFTNDPANFNGNGPNGACWERDADNHQGYATGPLAATVDQAPNAPGVQVVSTATWVGSNSTTVDHSYGAAGGYNLEVKIPLADLPSAIGPTSSPPTGSAATNAINPQHLGLNITPYDEDNTAAAGTTTLRHIDQSTRLAFSNDTGGVQADPFRWGHAYIPGYTPPAGRSTTPATPNVSHPNLDGVLSPQTIYQSATDGVPISGRDPAPTNDRIAIEKVKLNPEKVEFDFSATGPGTVHVFLWTGDHASIPVFLSSCGLANDPPPDYGFTPCAVTDGGIPPWSPDMSGRVVATATATIGSVRAKVKFDLSPGQADMLAAGGSALISFETPNDEVQALFVPSFDQ